MDPESVLNFVNNPDFPNQLLDEGTQLSAQAAQQRYDNVPAKFFDGVTGSAKLQTYTEPLKHTDQSHYPFIFFSSLSSTRYCRSRKYKSVSDLKSEFLV